MIDEGSAASIVSDSSLAEPVTMTSPEFSLIGCDLTSVPSLESNNCKWVPSLVSLRLKPSLAAADASKTDC
jgi:hypothetical protein